MLPIGAVVPFQHDRFRFVSRNDIDIGEQALVWLERKSFCGPVEPVAVRAQGGRLGVRWAVMFIAVPLPGTVRSGAGGELVLEPNSFARIANLIHAARRAGAKREHLDFRFGDVAFRLHDHFHLAGFRAGDVERLRRALARLVEAHVWRIVQDGVIRDDRRPLDQRDLVLLAPGAAAVDAIAERVLKAGAEASAIDGELPQTAVLFLADQIVLQRSAAVAAQLDPQLLRFPFLDADSERHIFAVEHLGVARRHGIEHPGRWWDIRQRQEDACQSRGHAVGEQTTYQKEGGRAAASEITGPAQAEKVEHRPRPKVADAVQRFAQQSAIEGWRLLNRAAVLRQVNAAHQPIVNARQVRFNPPGDLPRAEPAKKRPQHAGGKRPRGRHDDDRQSDAPQHHSQGRQQIQQRGREERAQEKAGR